MRKAVTSVEDMFVLAHLGIPRINASDWHLGIDGMVGRVASWSLDDLNARPKRTVEAVHQCCGNPQEPKVPTRRVSNVVWGGVALDELLRDVDVDPSARYLWSYGCDHGHIAGAHVDAYVKDLPLDRVAQGDVLVAYELNGAPLPAEHGFPARLVVPGYYGTNSVKWLSRLHLAADRPTSVFTTRLYNDVVETADGRLFHRPVWEIAPESVLVSPAPGAILARGQPTQVWGWGWSFRPAALVEVSLDGGASYRAASLEPRCGWAWQRFSLLWRPNVPGKIALRVRAADEDGNVQPDNGARNALHTVHVTVE
ncbi:molybdopterin-dependent oxidoreductase [Mesorhizobium tianshanense]|nr:molybdopterin-dependent oxidoreductase [Mesorhizobium tianshanense]